MDMEVFTETMNQFWEMPAPFGVVIQSVAIFYFGRYGLRIAREEAAVKQKEQKESDVAQYPKIKPHAA